MDGYLGEIRAFGFNYATPEWLPCNGQILQVSQYQALYAIIANTYGGTAPNTFALPNLQGYAVTGAGATSGKVVQVAQGAVVGEASVTLTEATMPAHTHILYPGQAPSGGTNYTNYAAQPSAGCMVNRLIAGVTSTSTTGVACLDYTSYSHVPSSDLTQLAAQSVSPTPTPSAPAHENRQPFQVFNFMICIEGEFPVPPN